MIPISMILAKMTISREIDLNNPACKALYSEAESLLQTALYVVCEVIEGKVTRPELFACMQQAMIEQDHKAMAQFAFAIHALSVGEGR